MIKLWINPGPRKAILGLVNFKLVPTMPGLVYSNRTVNMDNWWISVNILIVISI